MKKIINILLVFLCLTNIFAYEGMLAGQKDLKVIKTEFFDIIYTPDSEKSAAIIAQHGDDIYRELHKTYNLIHDFRMPVTITSSQDMFNAYFSNAPYNRIVLFDTQSPSSMAVFEENLLMVFRHELTHAITINIKTPFWATLTKILGDMINPYIFIPTSGQLEGIAIWEESRTGEGRIHSEFARHIVKQAKLENDFPNFAETTGARNIYVYDYDYKFGGEFMNYVRHTYGEEKLAEYWKKMTNLGGLSYFTIFKSVYGISMKDAWDDFQETFPVPQIPADPTETGLVSRFNTDKDFEQYILAASSKDKIVYYNQNTTGFYYLLADSSPTGYTKPKKFLQQSSIKSMNLSADGRYLTYVYQSTAGALPKNKMVIYDFKTRSKFSVPEERLNDGVVFTITEDAKQTKYLVANKNISQDSSLNIFHLKENTKGKIKEMELVETIDNRFNNFSVNLQADADGTIYYLSKEGIGYLIKSYNFITKVHKQYELPHQDMLLQGLSISTANDGSARALFSYVQPGTMPRLGEAKILPEGIEYTLYQQDFSGGVFTPVALGGNEILYIGYFLHGNHLFTANTLAMESTNQPGVVIDLGVRNQVENQSIANVDTSILQNATDFSVWPYLIKGTWYPLSTSSSYGLSKNFDSITSFGSVIGATFNGTLPWSSPSYILSAGYNLSAKSGTFHTSILGGTETSLFKYQMNNNLEVDGAGYKQTYHKIELTSKIPLTSTVSFTLSDSLDLFEGRQTYEVEKTAAEQENDNFLEKLNEMKTQIDSRSIFFTRNIASFNINYLPLQGRGRFNLLKFTVDSFVDTTYAADITNFASPLTNYNNLGLGVQIHIPQLLPLSSLTWGTWNLPFSVSARLYPSQSYFLQTKGRLVVFSFELQKAFNGFPIVFFNTITTELEYVSKFSNGINDSWAIVNMPSHFKTLGAGNMTYSDELITRIALTVTPNFGSLSRVAPTLNFDFKYRFFPEKDESPFDFTLGFAISL